MAKARVIDWWEQGKLFDVTVLRGCVDGSRITARLLWWSHGRFGIARPGAGTEETLAEGRRAPTAFEHLA